MDEPIRVLIVDDSEGDALLVARTLKKNGLWAVWERVDTPESMESALVKGTWDVAISDCHMPGFSAEGALAIWQRGGGDHPFIVVSGAIGEEEAVALLKAGAHDFVNKGNLARMVPALERELHEAELRRKARRVQKEFRESEEKYRLLFSTALEAIVILDAETCRVVESNASAENLFEISSMDFCGLSAESMFPEPGAAGEFLEEILHGGTERVPVLHLRKKEGTVFPAELSTGFFIWKERRMVVLMIRDITERQKMEQMKDEMLSAVSHEMRTPLTVMIGYIEFMMSNEVDLERQREYHGIILKETNRLKEMIENLLTFQRLRAGYGRKDFLPIAVPPLLHETVNYFRGASEKHQIDVVCSPDFPLLRGDEEKLQRALDNLISNAIKYSPNGGTITVGTHLEGGFAVFWVRDEGRGIPAPDLDGIFDRFFRLTTKEGERVGATGLGLPLVKEIVGAHGGKVWAESMPGRGSTFYFSIPVSDQSV